MVLVSSQAEFGKRRFEQNPTTLLIRFVLPSAYQQFYAYRHGCKICYDGAAVSFDPKGATTLRSLRYLLIFVPLAVIAEFLLHNDLLIFITAAIALIPLAGVLGEATEELALHLGPKIGGLLNATLGNAAELIITVIAIRAGKYELVKASLTGSIIGNLLLILSFALLLGGVRNGIQRFDRGLAGLSSSMMLLAVIGLIIPTMFELLAEIADPTRPLEIFNSEVTDPQLNVISLVVASVLLLLYLLSIVYQFSTPGGAAATEHGPGVTSHTGTAATAEPVTHTPTWSVPFSLGVLAISTFAIVFMSEFLVGVVDSGCASAGGP